MLRLRSYRASFDVRDRLVKLDPNNARLRGDLSYSYDNIGTVYRARGDLGAALQMYRDGLAIREQLVTHDPYNAQWQSDLAFSYSSIGGVQAYRET